MITCSTGLQACHTSRPKGLHYFLLIAICAPSIAHAQAVPKNLQILPKDTPAPQVVAQMQQFTRALGVQCTYCHIEQTAPLLTVEELEAQQAAAAAAAAAQAQTPQRGQGAQGQQAGRGRGRGRGPQGPLMDYAADDKRQKLTARVMIAMTDDINARLAAALNPSTRADGSARSGQGREITRVECATCHRGVTNPAQLSDLLRQTMLTKGEGAAVAQYRELRQQYLNSGAYDFREATLLDLGRESLATRKPDDALAWLQLNVEVYPQSALNFVELARAHLAKRDRDAALSDLKRALAVDPANADAKRELARLQK
jgi:tetratricopeptide (TPR) repeat protein